MTRSDGLVVSRAEFLHIEEIIEIENASFPDPWPLSFFKGILGDTNAYCTVAVLSGHVAGYSVLYRVLDEGEVYNIATAGEYGRRGIGTALLRDCISYGEKQGISKIYLEVRCGNLIAIAMYKKLGFNVSGIRRGYYKSPREDAIIMTYTFLH